MYRCKLCVAPVLDCKSRRQLSSSSLQYCAALLMDLACESGAAKNDATKEYTSGYLCKNCYRSICKYSALKEKVDTLKREMLLKLSPRSGDGATSESHGTKRKAEARAQQVTNAVKVVVTYKGCEKKYGLSPTREAIGKSLGRNCKRAFASHSFKSEAMRKHLLARVHRTIRTEMKKVLKELTVTVKDSKPDIFTTNTWESHFTALQHTAPVLTGILDACIPKHCSRRQCIVASCVAILTKSHCRSTLAHLFTSLILYSGHAAKQVYSRLQKLGLCLTSTSTLKLLDILGTDHDHIVKDWVTSLSKLTTNSHGYVSGLPASHLSDSTDSVTDSHLEFDAQSLTDPVYASTPQSSPTSLSFSDDSFVGNISPLTPEMSTFTSTSCEGSDDLTPQSTEKDMSSCLHQSDAGIGIESNEEWNGFRVVIDNVDLNVKCRDMRLNSQNTSLHYLHAYAVKDRISFKHLSTDATMVIPQDIDFNVLYPAPEDNIQLVSNFETLITRMLVHRIPGLQCLSVEVKQRIEHQYSMNMALKSEVVPLGVLLKNENVLGEMVDILDALHKYVPQTTSIQRFDVCTEGGSIRPVEYYVHNFSHIPIGGDQLTIARIRGSQKVLFHSENGDERLEGFIPVIEDWHAKMCFMEVIWKRLYNSCSGMDTGTLFQLRNLINRRNVVSDVSKDLTACEEFMELTTTSHVMTAAMHVAGVTNIADLSSRILSNDNPMATITSIVQTLCRQHVRVEFTLETSKSSHGSGDRVVEYAMETMSLGLLLLEFKDAIREGDGSRVLRCWKYFLILFRATQHKNYCIEALNILIQYYYILPCRYAEQMLWGRFVNSVGGPGNNISADLHMEHLNRLLKGTVKHLGANKTPQAIVRAGKALGVLKDILEYYDKLTGGWATNKHRTRSDTEDMMKMVTELSQNRVFTPQPGRNHETFPSIECNKLLEKVDKKKLHLWMTKKASEILKK